MLNESDSASPSKARRPVHEVLWTLSMFILFEQDDYDFVKSPLYSLHSMWSLIKSALDNRREETESLRSELTRVPNDNTLVNELRRHEIEEQIRSYPEVTRLACSAFTVMIFSSLEDSLGRICRKLPALVGLSHRPPKRLYVGNALNFMKTHLGFSIPPTTEIDNLSMVRNAIVHESGVPKRQQSAMEQYCRDNPDLLWLDDRGELQFSTQFPDRMSDNVFHFLRELHDRNERRLEALRAQYLARCSDTT